MADATPEAMEKARILIESVRGALRNGVKHYDSRGRLLATEREVIQCLVSEGQVEIEPPRAEA